MKYDDYWVDIRSDGLPIPEYCQVVASKFRSCIVPSEVGKRFTVDVTNLSLEQDIEARIYIDGRLLARIVVKSMGRNWASGAQVTHNVMRPFVFSKVVLTDDADIANPGEPEYLPSHLGSIQIHLIRVVVHKEQRWEGEMHYDNIGPIHEWPKEAGTHQVLLGQTEITSSVDYATVSRTDQPNAPFTTFIFYYRSKELLQAENIISSTNQPQPIKSIEPYRLQNGSLTHDSNTLRSPKQHSSSLLDETSPMSMKQSRYDSPEDIPILHTLDLYSSQESSVLTMSQPSSMKPAPGSSPEIHVLEERLAEMMEQTRAIQAQLAAKKAQAAQQAAAEVQAEAPGIMAMVTSLPHSSAFFKRDNDYSYYGLPNIGPVQQW
ncbi:hypothetical protein QCA50_020527 [Cerrena zonata]|uniref:DUF7918 domain-containing protein n=1 Tax=Cerrena zonata TaxID=2478898 RepID=A0AAW0FEF8_9APHY